MADQSLTTQDQRLTTQDSNSKLERAKRLLSPKAILAWALVLWTIIKFLYQSLNFASVVEFAAGLGRNPHVKTVLDFILSPLGQVFTTGLGIAWLTYLVLRKEPQKPLTSEQPQLIALPDSTAKLPPASEADLTFEIDADSSQVRVGDGNNEVQRIYADIKLRCFKKPDRLMAVRALHISLHRSWPLGDESTVVSQEDEVFIWEGPKMKAGRKKDVWTIRDPSTDRTYHFILEITPKISSESVGRLLPSRHDGCSWTGTTIADCICRRLAR